MGRCLIRRPLTVSVAPGHRLHTEEHTVSTILSDPLFVTAEVEYRLERLGGSTTHRVDTWPDVPSRLRRWLWDRRRPRRSSGTTTPLATSRPLHP